MTPRLVRPPTKALQCRGSRPSRQPAAALAASGPRSSRRRRRMAFRCRDGAGRPVGRSAPRPGRSWRRPGGVVHDRARRRSSIIRASQGGTLPLRRGRALRHTLRRHAGRQLPLPARLLAWRPHGRDFLEAEQRRPRAAVDTRPAKPRNLVRTSVMRASATDQESQPYVEELALGQLKIVLLARQVSAYAAAGAGGVVAGRDRPKPRVQRAISSACCSRRSSSASVRAMSGVSSSSQTLKART